MQSVGLILDIFAFPLGYMASWACPTNHLAARLVRSTDTLRHQKGGLAIEEHLDCVVETLKTKLVVKQNPR